MNQGFINRLKKQIADIKEELTEGRAGHEDSSLTEDQQNALFEKLGTLVSLLQQFEE